MFGSPQLTNQTISELLLASYTNRVLVPIPSYKNEIPFTRKLNSFSYELLCTGLALTARLKATQKWAIITWYRATEHLTRINNQQQTYMEA